MMQAGLTTIENESRAADHLVNALIDSKSAIDRTYTLVGAAALRYMLPSMAQLVNDQDTPLMITEKGWRLQSAFLLTQQCKQWRLDVAEKLTRKSSAKSPEQEMFRAISRTVAGYLTLGHLLMRCPDPSFGLGEKYQLLNTIFMGLNELPWYPGQTLRRDDPAWQIFGKVFQKVTYAISSSFPGLSININFSTTRKNLAHLFDLLRLCDFNDVRHVPVTVFSHIRDVAGAPSDTRKRLLPLLLQEFRRAGQAPAIVRRPAKPRRQRKRRQTTEAWCSISEWPIAYEDDEKKKPLETTYGNPPRFPGCTMLKASGARWEVSRLLPPDTPPAENEILGSNVPAAPTGDDENKDTTRGEDILAPPLPAEIFPLNETERPSLPAPVEAPNLEPLPAPVPVSGTDLPAQNDRTFPVTEMNDPLENSYPMSPLFDGLGTTTSLNFEHLSDFNEDGFADGHGTTPRQ